MTSLVGCGGDDYCAALKDYDADAELASTNFRTDEGSQRILDVFVDLRSSAPDELSDEYDAVIDALRTIIDGEAEDLDREALADDYEAISSDARDRCDVDMG